MKKLFWKGGDYSNWIMEWESALVLLLHRWRTFSMFAVICRPKTDNYHWRSERFECICEFLREDDKLNASTKKNCTPEWKYIIEVQVVWWSGHYINFLELINRIRLTINSVVVNDLFWDLGDLWNFSFRYAVDQWFWINGMCFRVLIDGDLL